LVPHSLTLAVPLCAPCSQSSEFLSEGGGGGGGKAAAGAGSGDTGGEAVASDLPRVPPALATPGADPKPFQCPSCGEYYDCGKRQPRIVPCCKRVMCRKCTGVLESLPGPSTCALCGAREVGPFDLGACPVDRGLLLVLAGNVPPEEPYVC
jgi:hypothetical protein